MTDDKIIQDINSRQWKLYKAHELTMQIKWNTTENE